MQGRESNAGARPGLHRRLQCCEETKRELFVTGHLPQDVFTLAELHWLLVYISFYVWAAACKNFPPKHFVFIEHSNFETATFVLLVSCKQLCDHPWIRRSNCLGHAVCPGEPDMANVSLKAHFRVLCFWEKTLFLAADTWKNAGEKRFQMHWPWGPSVSNAEGAKGDQLHECHSFCWEQLSHPHKSPKGNKQMLVGSRLYPL